MRIVEGDPKKVVGRAVDDKRGNVVGPDVRYFNSSVMDQTLHLLVRVFYSMHGLSCIQPLGLL